LPILREKGSKYPDIITDEKQDFSILIEGDNYHSLSVLSYAHKNKIDWWFKNGDAKNEIYLGIPYTDEKDKPATFYPDFIVHYKNGKTGIFDPKEGQTATSNDTKLKAEAL